MKRGGPLKRRTPLKATKGLARKRAMTPAALAAQKANAAKRGPYVRRGKTITCENPTCGREFYVSPGGVGRRRFCSRACMGFISQIERSCTVCGRKFKVKPGRGPRKTCGTACRNEAIRRSKLAGKNPNYKGAHLRPTREWRAAKRDRCGVCGGTRQLRQHHVVYEQHVRKRGGDPWDPRDSLTVCLGCHNGHHHSPDRRIHVACLSEANLSFALELMGAAAADYFLRYYDGEWDEIAHLFDRGPDREAAVRTA